MSFSPAQTAFPGRQSLAMGGGTLNVALPSPTGAGHTVFLVIAYPANTNTGSSAVSSVTDTQGNTWSLLKSAGPSGTDGAAAELWTASVSAASLTVHAAMTNSSGAAVGVYLALLEAPGVFTPDAGINSSAATTDAVGAAETANITTTQDNDLCFAVWSMRALTTQPITCDWTVLLSDNVDYPTPGTPSVYEYGAFLWAVLEAGPAGAYAVNVTHADLNLGQPPGFGEAPANDWGASLLAVSGQLTFPPLVDECGVSHTYQRGAIVADVCRRAGLEPWQIDTSLLTPTNLGGPTANIVPGYAIVRPTPAKDVLRPLMDGYFFGGRETNAQMQFVPLGLSSAMSIPEGDLGLKADSRKLEEEIGQEGDLPRFCTVTFDDPTLDYQQNKQIKQRNTRIVSTNQQKIIELPLTQLPDWAMQVATKSLYLAWLERFRYTINLWRALYALLDPMDVVTFTYEGLTFQIRVVESTVGAGLAIAISGVSEYAQVLQSGSTGGIGLGFPGSPLKVLLTPSLWIFDIPLLRDIDSNFPNTGFYFAMSSPSPSWQGGVLYNSTDNVNFAVEASEPNAATFGVATTTLGAPPRSPWTWDRTNTLTVFLSRGSFASDTALNVCNGSNVLIVGSEIIQFQTAVQNSDGSWTLSNLLRGRRGTEWACGTHVANELVVAPATGALRVTLPLSTVSQTIYYKGGTIGQDPSTVSSTAVALTGADLKPYAPVHITGSRDISGNLTIVWVRRTRVGWLNLAQDPVPLSEDSEAYVIEIYNGPTLVRTIASLTSPTAGYSAAQQTTDFGSPQASVSLKVYQVSGEIGKGFAGVATV